MTLANHAADLFLIGSVWLVAAVVPGPEVLTIIHATTTGGRRCGLATVLGIVAGTIIWGMAGYSGIAVLLQIAPWSYLLLKLMGGAYLIFLGIGLLRSARDRQGTATGVAQPGSVACAWFRGLAVNLANPESAVLVASIYAVSLPPEPGLALGAAVIAVIALISLGWYSVLVLAVGNVRWMGVRMRFGRWIARLAGGALVLLGARLMTSR